MSDDIMVSICCATYNHERYLRKALNGVLAQKVDFRYQIIICEDCSTDGSKQIVKEYEERYPEKIVAIYQKQNKGPVQNFADLYSYANGKYVITLETDDYWVDDKKLAKQVEFLENHPDYVAVSHRTFIVDENGRCLKNVIYPECKRQKFDVKEMMLWRTAGQVTTMLYRNFHQDKETNDALIRISALGPGDKAKELLLSNRGKIFRMNERMSCYRYVTKGGSGFSANNKLKYYDYYRMFDQLYSFMLERRYKPECVETTEYLRLEALAACTLLEHSVPISCFAKECFKCTHKAHFIVKLGVHSVLKLFSFFSKRIVGITYI